MLNTLDQKYEDALEAISVLQDMLYNIKKLRRNLSKNSWYAGDTT